MLLIFVGLVGTACGEADQGDTANTGSIAGTGSQTTGAGTTGASSTTDLTPEDISHAVHIQPIWDAKCGSTCHLNAFSSGQLNLEGDGYDDLVNVGAFQAPMQRVTPGSPEDSYLWHKLNGTQASVGGSGLDMPKLDSLSNGEMTRIELWIIGGANP